MALVTGTASRNRVSRAFLLRSPRDTPLPLFMNVLLSGWDTKPAQAQQEDVPHPALATPQNVFLCRESGRPQMPVEGVR